MSMSEFHEKLGNRGKAPREDRKSGATGKGSYEFEWQGTEKNTKDFRKENK